MKKRFRDEFVGAELGDTRRSDRLVELAERLRLFPADSFPKALGDGAALEAGYRFLSNSAVESESIAAPHVRETVERCSERETVVVAHDTTDFVFSGERRGLGRMRGEHEQGFFCHLSLAVSLDDWREPLGVLNSKVWTRKEKRNKSGRKRQRDPNSESTRWSECIELVTAQMPETDAIHVMDREADAYELLCELIARERRFVIRSRIDRRLADGGKLVEKLATSPVALKREVELSKRKPAPFPKQRKIHPPRNARSATLAIKATSVTLLRPSDVSSSYPKSLELNVVVVDETDPPQGESPVSWRLFTMEPIKNASDLELIVDAYRCRWRIEEFFKALKTGCAIEKRQLESCHALKNALAIYVPIAWRVLRHRTQAHADGDKRATTVLTALQIKILRRKTEKKLPRSLNAADALLAVAALGGHLKRNGPPGWITLSRGYERLLTLEEGAILASEM